MGTGGGIRGGNSGGLSIHAGYFGFPLTLSEIPGKPLAELSPGSCLCPQIPWEGANLGVTVSCSELPTRVSVQEKNGAYMLWLNPLGA